MLVGRAQTNSPHYDAGHLMDLTERWKRDRFSLGDYALMYGERWCDRAYGMPSWVEPFAVFYNKSLLRQSGVPDPWDAPPSGDWTGTIWCAWPGA